MSVFSIIKRRQSKEDKAAATAAASAKKAGKQKQEPLPPTKYRHIPTHAAADALLGAPAGWMRGDAERIRESNQKRIALSVSNSETRLPQSSSSSMLSPLHINVHASGSTSSASSIRNYPHSSSRRNSQYRKSVAVTSATGSATAPASASASRPSSSANMHMSSSFKSLDAEIYRSRKPTAAAADAHDAYVLSSSPINTTTTTTKSGPPSRDQSGTRQTGHAGDGVDSDRPRLAEGDALEMLALPPYGRPRKAQAMTQALPRPACNTASA